MELIISFVAAANHLEVTDDEDLARLVDNVMYIFAEAEDGSVELSTDALGMVDWTDREVYILPTDSAYRIPNFGRDDDPLLGHWLTDLAGCSIIGRADKFEDYRIG